METQFQSMTEHGIDSKGYGRLAKIVMLDPDLTLDAKAIYAYFCSYRGAGTTKVFPSRDKILHDLNIGKDSYYKHLQLLVSNGYIRISQTCQKNANNGYVSNNYEIVEYPTKYSVVPETASNRTKTDYLKIQESESISTAGYGNSPKLVMQDTSLSLKAKGLYAYICAFAGAGYEAAPSKDTALAHLRISSNSYSKYAKELVDHHYLERVQDNSNGSFGHITYRIILNPDCPLTDIKSSDTVSTDPKLSDTVSDVVVCTVPDIKNNDTVFQPDSKFSDAVCSADIKKSNTLSSDTGFLDSNNNSFSKQTASYKSIYPSDSSALLSSSDSDGVMDQNNSFSLDSVFVDLQEFNGIPFAYSSNPLKLSSALKLIFDWDTFSDFSFYSGDLANTRYQLYFLFMDCLEYMCTSGHFTTVQGSQISYSKVLDALNRLIAMFPGPCYDGSISFIVDRVLDKYISRSRLTVIKNENAYLKALIWTELTTSVVSDSSITLHDFPV